MAEMQYQITETFLPGSPQQREQRLQSLLAGYRRMLEEQLMQDVPPQLPAISEGPPACPEQAPCPAAPEGRPAP